MAADHAGQLAEAAGGHGSLHLEIQPVCYLLSFRAKPHEKVSLSRDHGDGQMVVIVNFLYELVRPGRGEQKVTPFSRTTQIRVKRELVDSQCSIVL